MSCITIVGRERRWNAACDVPLPRHSPVWSASKQERLYNQAVSDDPKLRAIAANHPRLPQGWMYHLLNDEDVTVRRAAVRNPALPRALVLYARQDADLGIAAYARLLAEES